MKGPPSNFKKTTRGYPKGIIMKNNYKDASFSDNAQSKFITKIPCINDGTENRYMKLNLDTLHNENLSPVALVALMHILSTPDFFVIHKNQLMKKLKIGINAIDSIFKELIKNEYMIGIVYKSKDEDGRFFSNCFEAGGCFRMTTGIEYIAFEKPAAMNQKLQKRHELISFMATNNRPHIFECKFCKFTEKIIQSHSHGTHSHEIHEYGEPPIFYKYYSSIDKSLFSSNVCDSITHARGKKENLNDLNKRPAEIFSGTQAPHLINPVRKTASHEEDRVERAMEFDRYEEYRESYEGQLVSVKESHHQKDCEEFGASFMKDCYLHLAYFKFNARQVGRTKPFGDDHFMLHDWVIHKMLQRKRIESFQNPNSISSTVQKAGIDGMNDWERLMQANPQQREQARVAAENQAKINHNPKPNSSQE